MKKYYFLVLPLILMGLVNLKAESTDTASDYNKVVFNVHDLDFASDENKQAIRQNLAQLQEGDDHEAYILQLRKVLKNRSSFRDTLFRHEIQFALAEHYMHRYRFDSALVHIDALMKLLESSSFKKELGVVIYRKSVIHYAIGEYENALELIFRAIEESQHSNDDIQLGKAYLQLGNLYYFLKSFNDAEEFYLQGKKYFSQAGDAYGVANCNSNLGLLATNMGEYAKGVGYQIVALKEIEKSGNEIAIGNTYHYLAEGYLGLLNYDSASFYVEKSIISNQKTSYFTGLCFDYLIKAEIALGRNKLNELRDYHLEARKYFEKQPNTDAEKELTHFEAKLYKKQGKYKKAHAALERYTTIVDSLSVDDNRMKMLALQQKGKLSRAQYDLRIAKERARLKEVENAIQQKQILIITGIAILMLVSLIVSLIILRKNKRLNNELEIQKDQIDKQLAIKESLLSEIHHRVKNNLQIISSMLSLQAQYIGNKELENVISVCKARINSMSLIHESLYKTKDRNTPLFSDYVKNLIPFLIETYQVDETKISLEMNIDSIELSHDDSLPCGLIINEIVSNALKHAFPNDENGTILIEMSKNQDIILLKVSDNGKGLPNEIDPQSQDSFGFLLIYTLADQLEANVNLNLSGGLSFEFSWFDKGNLD